MNKLTSVLAIVLVLVNLTSTISAHEIVWTEYSDTTSTSFVIENPAEQPEPEEPCNNIDITDEIEKDREYEQAIKETKYGNWICINNQLQRINTINGKQTVEYSGQCGIIEKSKPAQKTTLDILILLPFTLFILLLIFLVA